MTPSRTTDLGHSLCFGGAGLGAIGLIGWVTGTVALITIVPGQPPMMPNTALGLLLLGGAGAMRGSTSLGAVTRLLSMLMASFVLLLGLVTLAEYTWNLPFSIDELPFSIDRFLIRDAGDPYPGHQSPPTALAFVLLGADEGAVGRPVLAGGRAADHGGGAARGRAGPGDPVEVAVGRRPVEVAAADEQHAARGGEALRRAHGELVRAGDTGVRAEPAPEQLGLADQGVVELAAAVVEHAGQRRDFRVEGGFHAAVGARRGAR